MVFFGCCLVGWLGIFVGCFVCLFVFYLDQVLSGSAFVIGNQVCVPTCIKE